MFTKLQDKKQQHVIEKPVVIEPRNMIQVQGEACHKSYIGLILKPDYSKETMHIKGECKK
jgi:hypothetical protein